MCSRRFAIARQCVKKNATTAAADRRAGKTGGLNSRRRAICTTRVRGIATQGVRAAKPADADKAAPEKKGTLSIRERSVRAGPVSRVLFPGRTPDLCHLSRAAVSCRLKQPTPRNCRYTRSCNPRDVLPGDIAAPAVGFYPAFSPLPAGKSLVGGSFLLRSYTLTDIKSLACAALCVARTFLSRPRPAATERTCTAKVIKFGGIPASGAAIFGKCVSILRAGRPDAARANFFGNIGLNSTFAKRLIPSPAAAESCE